VADVLRGEASRRMVHPGQVLIDFICACWPAYIAGTARRELSQPLDETAVDSRYNDDPGALTTRAVQVRQLSVPAPPVYRDAHDSGVPDGP
jgi:hypothetical protein